jgi:parallel beta-helix repeat protein
MTLPTIFLGSSKEGLKLTKKLGAELGRSGKVAVLPWTEAFHPGNGTLEDLAKRLDEVDFAAFLLLPDDEVRMRDRTHDVPRDNVVFELGLFMGKLNRHRTFALVEDPGADEERRVQLLSDLAGTTYVPFTRSDMSAATRKLIEKIEEHGPVPRTPRGTHVVERGAEGRSVYETIADAVAAAEAGDVILVRPGRYTEPLVIDKPLEIIGVGVFDEANRAVVSTADATAITYEAEGGHGRIATLNIEAAGEHACAIDVTDGTVTVRSCHITGHGPIKACVRVGGDGMARIDGNHITDTEGVGVLICEQADARLTDNLIEGHGYSCVEIRDGTQPTVDRNRIGEGRSGGLWLHGGSHAEIDRNDIYGHGMAGITITDGADPTINGNRIHDGLDAGIYVGRGGEGKPGGRGTIRDNIVYRNSGTGIDIADGGEPLVARNYIYDGEGGGLTLRSGARGRINANRIRGNRRAGVAFLTGAQPVTFTANTVSDGLAEGVYDETGRDRGDNDVQRNAKHDWVAAPIDE